MPGCLMRVYGRRFDVDRYLKRSSAFSVPRVFKKGEKRFPNSKRFDTRYRYSGFNVRVCEATGARISPQIAKAMRFMQKHSREIKFLTRHKGVDAVEFDFGLHFRIQWMKDGGVRRRIICPQFDYLPAEFIKAAARLGIGIELSHY